MVPKVDRDLAAGDHLDGSDHRGDRPVLIPAICTYETSV
jgi:hypothetical protein